MRPRPRARSLLQVAVAATLWGTWSLFLRGAHADPRWTAALIMGIITVVTAPLLFLRSARGPLDDLGPRTLADWRAMALLGVFDAGNAVLFFAAMETTTIAIAVLSHYLAPVLVALFAPFFLGTRTDRRTVALAFVALGGLALVLQPWRMVEGKAALGALLGGGSAVFYASNVIVTKRMGMRFTAEEQLVFHGVVATLLLALFAIAVGAHFPDAHTLARIGGAAVIIGATAGLLFLYGLKAVAAEHAAILCFLEPLTAVAVAAIAFDERPSAIAIGGAILVLAAGVGAVRGERGAT